MQNREQLFQQWTDERGEDYAKWMMEGRSDVERMETELDAIDEQKARRRSPQIVEKRTIIIQKRYPLWYISPWNLSALVGIVIILYYLWF